MHVLGHGFGHRRKSSPRRPRDLHIRKVSFSGSSHSGYSAESTSSSSSTPTACTPTAGNPPVAASGLDPLHLHPAFHAPPRLHERPFIHADQPVLAIIDDEEDVYTNDESESESVCTPQQPQQLGGIAVDGDDYEDEDQAEPQDYFFTTLSKRPPMPRSHWSESTIQTIDNFDADDASDTSDDDEEIVGADGDLAAETTDDSDDDDDASVLEMRRLSRHLQRGNAAALQALSVNVAYNPRPTLVAASAPKRPPMRSLDSVDTFIRRGGWKRRGIVFRSEDMENQSRPERASC